MIFNDLVWSAVVDAEYVEAVGDLGLGNDLSTSRQTPYLWTNIGYQILRYMQNLSIYYFVRRYSLCLGLCLNYQIL